ncbi:unnamed protein product [Protopolystoma xenopodis]|uniref:Uncharacterized protein n=1 Tax=Protopolystoma xenopodis TaxID=117903 RepID=A0A3S5BMJ7_9PLAT|nr:unnamed protein product [Protopolystoma xenopodis]
MISIFTSDAPGAECSVAILDMDSVTEGASMPISFNKPVEYEFTNQPNWEHIEIDAREISGENNQTEKAAAATNSIQLFEQNPVISQDLSYQAEVETELKVPEAGLADCGPIACESFGISDDQDALAVTLAAQGQQTTQLGVETTSSLALVTTSQQTPEGIEGDHLGLGGSQNLTEEALESQISADDKLPSKALLFP